MAEEVPGVVIKRGTHSVIAAGESIERVDIEIQTDLPGDPRFSRSTNHSILGEQDSLMNLSYSIEVNRPRSIYDDPFPVSMPATICNATIYGREDRSDGMTPTLPLEYMEMTHLYVQDEARGRGYGQLLWDCYLALVVYGEYEARGKIGDDTDRNTVAFLKSKGVPAEDITESDSSAWLGTNRAVWATEGRNLTGGEPITLQQFFV
jgi:GNAT superfamily N-acetyltransferase